MALAGDSSELDRLVREHLPSALRFAVRLTGDLDAAEELVQEALLRVARGWQSFRGEARFRTWLFRIVINAFRDQPHGRPATTELPDGLRDQHGPDPVAEAIANELSERIATLVAQLPPRQREVLVLVAYEGLSTAEVAAMLRVSESNVRMNLSYARQRLKQQLAGYLAEK